MRAFLIASLLLSFSAHASPEGDSAKARIEYKEASKLYNLGEYKDALARFKAAYLALPDPVFLFNIAQCHRQLQEWQSAGKAYRAFLREAPNIAQKTREDVQRLLNEMEQAVRDERAKAPPTETRPPGTEPPAKEVVQQPPPQQPPPPEQPPPPPPAPSPWYKSAPGMALTFGGIGVAAIGGGLLGAAGSKDSSSRTASTEGGARDLHNSAVTFQNAGIALVAVGAAAFVTGTILLIVHSRKHAPSMQAAR